MVRSWLGAGVGSLVLLVSATAHAQCTMDTDCKGDRICEEGRCTAPLPPAAEVAPAAPAPVVAPVPAPPPSPAPSPPPPAMVLVPDPPPPKMVRHSTGMMVGGIVMVAIAPIALFISAGAAVSSSLCSSYDRSIDGSYYDECDNDGLVYGSLLTGAALLGAGIPMIVVGAKKEPAKPPVATVAPWATPTGAGLGVRFAL